MLKEIIQETIKKGWVNKVKPKWTPPEGTFAKDANPVESAKVICQGHNGDYKKAVASVNFFFNRAGICEKGNPKFDEEWCKLKEKIITELEKICGKE
jgi:hypothetical protein